GGWSRLGHCQRIHRASGIVATTPLRSEFSHARASGTHLLPEPNLLHSFIRTFSRSPFAHPIQPLPPEFLVAAPLAAPRKSGETARFCKSRYPRSLPCETLGRWI